MQGIHTLNIRCHKLEYRLSFRRNVTFIRGMSGTGKTTICSLIHRKLLEKKLSPVKISSSAPVLLMVEDWEVIKAVLKTITGHIFLYDEDCYYINSKEFAEELQRSDNYHVILSRELLTSIPYSVNEIYELQTTLEDDVYVHIMKSVYKDCMLQHKINCVVMEDTNSGREMFSHIFGNVLDTKGENSSLHNEIKNLVDGLNPLLIVDGAAFGSYITDIYTDFITRGKCSIWAPESFEYLLLLSKVVWRRDVDVILSDPYSQISSELFLTWERFFTWLVTDIMKDYPGHEYSKKKLSDWYFTDANINKIISILPEGIKKLIK